MGGPWFAVHESGGDWQTLGSVWISNGRTDCRGVAEFKVEFAGDGETEAIAAASKSAAKDTDAVGRQVLLTSDSLK